MFYRFKSKFAVQARLETFIVGIPNSDKKPVIPGPKAYDQCFDLINKDKFVTVYKAPVYKSIFGLALRCHPGKENEIIPDLWGIENSLICSEKFKALVEIHDNFEHEFIEIDVLDDKENKLDKGQRYYWFNVRRFIDIEENRVEVVKFSFDEHEEESGRLSTCLSDQKLIDELSTFPVWRWVTRDAKKSRLEEYYQVLFLSSDFVKQINQAGLKGFEHYSLPYGVAEESLVCVNWHRGK